MYCSIWYHLQSTSAVHWLQVKLVTFFSSDSHLFLIKTSLKALLGQGEILRYFIEAEECFLCFLTDVSV